ncbi:4Fe-4S single cluster domain-containing protein [Gordonia sp. AC31]|uniref:4Fe-4S single cluster domain-containing protein n=1 Tax=Gordonia sp. AC31 TaxID=2962571 RepID=UPI002881124F|nr:4Fe-4S single cluster domain-containing protein [Gordonia sp. AC31]MDT0223758.1 4Fe-4S single cluster domain-containing protein [Gordonia sp. AC31]
MLRIGAVIDSTIAEGPGRRFAVWAQGCTIRCPGCFNPHLWGDRGGTAVGPAELAARAIASQNLGVEGVTLLGGEPFEQATDFATFAAEVAAQGLSVMVFSGYERDHLDSPQAPVGSRELLSHTDLLISGPFVADHPDHDRPWVGSTNQEFHFLTDRYRHMADELGVQPDRIEVRVAATGEVSINGWATTDQLELLLLNEDAGSSPAPSFRRGTGRRLP